MSISHKSVFFIVMNPSKLTLAKRNLTSSYSPNLRKVLQQTNLALAKRNLTSSYSPNLRKVLQQTNLVSCIVLPGLVNVFHLLVELHVGE